MDVSANHDKPHGVVVPAMSFVVPGATVVVPAQTMPVIPNPPAPPPAVKPKVDCTVPYTWVNGKKEWKRDCKLGD